MKRRRFRWIREKERFDEDAGKGTPQREEMAVRLSSGQVLLYPAIHRGIAHIAQCAEQFRVHQSAEDRAFASVILAVEVGFGASERAIGVRIEVDRDKDRGWSRRCDPGLLLYASGLDRVPGHDRRNPAVVGSGEPNRQTAIFEPAPDALGDVQRELILGEAATGCSYVPGRVARIESDVNRLDGLPDSFAFDPR